jgi:hypothetical protein
MNEAFRELDSIRWNFAVLPWIRLKYFPQQTFCDQSLAMVILRSSDDLQVCSICRCALKYYMFLFCVHNLCHCLNTTKVAGIVPN